MSADRDLIKASGPLGIVGYRRMPMWRLVAVSLVLTMTTLKFICWEYRLARVQGTGIVRAAINAIMRGTERAPF